MTYEVCGKAAKFVVKHKSLPVGEGLVPSQGYKAGIKPATTLPRAQKARRGV
jgi:hypothetical protein